MRIQEILTEEDEQDQAQDQAPPKPKEYVYHGKAPKEWGENIEIDWVQLKAALTIIATDPDLKGGVKPVDAIMFLGIIGDPNADDETELYLKKPARWGSINDQGIENVPRWKRIQGEYQSGSGHGGGWSWTENYDIVLNHNFYNKAMDPKSYAPELVAHEARHRGFEILLRSGKMRAMIPSWLMDIHYKHYNEYIRPGEPEGYSDSFEHLMMYSLETGASKSIGSYKDRMFYRSREELKQFRTYYYTYEAAAKRYLATLKVPPGGYEALRKAVDDATPPDIKITIQKGPDGKPVLKGGPKNKEPKAADPNAVDPKAADSAATPKNQNPNPNNKDAVTTYTVKRGDNLNKISKMYGVPLSKVIKANPQIKNPNLIYPGDQVTIPS